MWCSGEASPPRRLRAVRGSCCIATAAERVKEKKEKLSLAPECPVANWGLGVRGRLREEKELLLSVGEVALSNLLSRPRSREGGGRREEKARRELLHAGQA